MGDKPPPPKSVVSVISEAWEELSSGSPPNTAQLHYVLAGEGVT